VLPSSCGLILSECGGNQHLRRLTKEVSFVEDPYVLSPVRRLEKMRGRRMRRRGAETGRTANPFQANERHHPTPVPSTVRDPPVTRRADVMNLERSALATMPLALAGILTAFDAHGQTPRDCSGRVGAPAEVARELVAAGQALVSPAPSAATC